MTKEFFKTFEEFAQELSEDYIKVGNYVWIAFDEISNLPFLDCTKSYYLENHKFYWELTPIENVDNRDLEFRIILNKSGDEYVMSYDINKLWENSSWNVFPRKNRDSKSIPVYLETRDIVFYSGESVPPEVINKANEDVASHLRRTLREWPYDHDLAINTKIIYGDYENILRCSWYWKEKKEFHPKVI